jgi:hypothetical protein
MLRYVLEMTAFIDQAYLILLEMEYHETVFEIYTTFVIWLLPYIISTMNILCIKSTTFWWTRETYVALCRTYQTGQCDYVTQCTVLVATERAVCVSCSAVSPISTQALPFSAHLIICSPRVKHVRQVTSNTKCHMQSAMYIIKEEI